MKKLVFWLIVTVLALLFLMGGMWQQVKYANEKWEVATSNMKAYDAQLAAEDQKNMALQLTIDQLGYFRDSVLTELNATRKKLGVKNNNLKALQSVSSSFSKSDTIILRDTLFKEVSVAVDTVLGDSWYSVRLGLHYPSMVAVKPYFKSEKHIVVSSKKETVNPPKKFFLLRWLQRKHYVLHIDVVEQNPYVEGEHSRYVEILR